ncbi:MAG TPA: HNH endonuclease family protein, partial [Blastococcus sp.]
MTDQSAQRRRRIVSGVVAGVVLLFIVAGMAGSGLSGGLIVAGLAALLVGLGAAVAGQARWAFIASRRIGGIVAAAGLVALMVGGATSPPTKETAAGSGFRSTGSAETTDRAEQAAEKAADEAAEEAAAEKAAEKAAEEAEAALAEAETAERTVAADALAGSGLLNDAASQAAVEAAGSTTALAALAAVEVKGRAPRTGYDRDNFGSAWADVDRNGCDTRNDILARDLTKETFKAGTRNCVVLTGELADPYRPHTIAFTRGQGTSDDVQIDHVVALSDAWQKGAQGLDQGRRTAFANDPLNLLAVDGPLNMQKGDGDAATWLPPNRGYRCAYVARQVAVKVSYQLWMTQAEKNAIATVLASCPNEPLPGGVVAEIPERVQPAPTPAPAP